jgi:hypothetical protein
VAAQPRYVARSMCSLDDADATRTWLLLDRATGLPLTDLDGIRTFEKADAQAELARLNRLDARPT